MRTLLLTLAAAAALALAAGASAGGWATAGVSPPPGDPTAGSTWDAKVTILQHGETPLVGMSPTLTLTGKGGERATFPAEATKEPGVYLAKVKFPSAGSWSYEVYDGFGTYGGAQTAHVRGHLGRRELGRLQRRRASVASVDRRDPAGSGCSVRAVHGRCGEPGRARPRRSDPGGTGGTQIGRSARFTQVAFAFPF